MNPDPLETLTRLVAADPWRMQTLQAVHKLRLPDWAIGAGFVRNCVWDDLHQFAEPTPLGDIDVLFFDPENETRAYEMALEARLSSDLPDRPWSVRNQARMHLRNGDKPYRDTADAMRHWLETVTCVAVRLVSDDRLGVIAPFGIDDLLAMRCRPTETGRRKPHEYIARMTVKDWPARWPKVSVERP